MCELGGFFLWFKSTASGGAVYPPVERLSPGPWERTPRHCARPYRAVLGRAPFPPVNANPAAAARTANERRRP